MQSAKADLAWIRRLFHDVVQRSPMPREAAGYAGLPVERVANHLLGTLEAMSEWVEEELYYFLLLDAFRPRTRAIESLPERLKKRTVTARDAIGEILLSTGFSLRNPGNDTFVTVVLEQCLGLEVQDRRNRATLEAGKQLYDGTKARFLGTFGESQSDIIKIVLSQRAFTRHLLERHHQRLFDAPLDRGKDTDALIERLHTTPTEFFPILGEWLTSERYRAAVATKRPRTDRQFVRSLYTDLLGRTPTYEELRNMRNALQSMADSTPLRAVMVKLMLDSKDARLPDYEKGKEAAFVTDCFRRYLGRDPRQDEAARIAAILREPDATPRHVVRALLGSAEYQYY